MCMCVCNRVKIKNDRWEYKRTWELFFNRNLAERDGSSRDAISHISFYLFLFCLIFFTYSEALPALRLRRDDIFGPPVGSALNNP